MTKNILLAILFLLSSMAIQAQQPRVDTRTTETKIADLIMKLPVQSSASLHQVMSELSQLGAPVIAQLVPSLVPPGKGDDMQIRYAISGLVKYIASDKTRMPVFSEAICNAMKNIPDDEVKDFLLQELQYIAGNEAIPTVAPLLTHPRLGDPAARVLVNINTPEAGKALLSALNKAKKPNKAVLVQALGEIRYPIATKPIEKLASSSDLKLKATALYALAETGNPSSAKVLRAAAGKADFAWDNTGSTHAYLRYLQRLTEDGRNSLAENPARELTFNAALPIVVRNTAMSVYTRAAGAKAVTELLQALRSQDNEVRTAALALLGNIYSDQVSAEMQGLLKNHSNTGLQAEIIRLMADQQDKNALPFMMNFLESEDPFLQLASIHALTKMGHKEATTSMLNLLKKADSQMIPEIKKALLRLGGDELADQAAALMPTASGPAKVAFIEILAARKAQKYAKLIAAQVTDTDARVSAAAANALKEVATSSDTDLIAGLLSKQSGKEEIAALQQAFHASIREMIPKTEQVNIVKKWMNAPGSEETRYYSILSRIGGSQALAVVEDRLENGTDRQKETALAAITSWTDESALPLLYKLGKSLENAQQKASALAGYISGINRSKYPSDQKVLMLRNAMELAATPQQKRSVLSQSAQNPTLQSLVFVSRYLPDTDTEQAAVQAIRSIVTNNTTLYGTAVSEIVEKAVSLNKHAEAEYQKEELLRHMSTLPKDGGFVKMFNEKDLTGWKGLVGNPITRAKMTPEKLAEEQAKADERMRRDWRVENGLLIFEGKGYDNLCSEKMYADFELILDWRMEPKGDGGVYLRGSPQVQTWDTTRVEVGAQVGSGGLYNNQVHRSKPLLVADNPINEWNTFRIRMIGDKVTVYLNGQLVTDNVILENYWDRKQPIFEREAIELQAHGTRLDFRDIYVREIPRPEPYVISDEEKQEGFKPMFNGIDLAGWTGNQVDYFAQEGMIVCQPSGQGSGNLFTEKEYSDFIMRFEFQLTPGANNGLGIRTPLKGDAAYVGMELQILDNEAAIYRNLRPYQYHGSVYGVIPAKRGFLKPVGEWNYQEVKAVGNRITITLNGEVILDGDLAEASNNGTATIDNREHPGLLNKSGHIGFLGHGSPLKFRNLRIKDIAQP